MLTCPSCAAENPEGFAFCGHCGVALGEPATRDLHEERKTVSVLFCDLVGFTAASEGADPEDVRARVRPYHERLRADIEHFDGTIEKFIGDAVMAVFGAPITHEDDAERAVRAGLRILDGLSELNRAEPELGLRVRIGINTGEALVSLGSRPELGEGFVAGDVVNTASRIQAAAPVDGVAVSEETFRQTERVFVFEALPPAEMKGKAEPVALYRVLEPRARFGSDLIRTHDSPFVGRLVERSLLTSLFDRSARDSQTQLVTLIGEPGAGKSRLVAELFAYIDARSELITWRQGRCLPYGDGITFWALGEIVKAQAGVFESDSPEAAAEKLDAVLPDLEARAFMRARLLPLLGIDAGLATTREESFSAWRSFVESLAADGPAVLVFEDLHWADPALLEFLTYLAEWAEGVPLLLVCTARPELAESNPSWGSGIRNAHTINLTPLTAAETNELVVALLARSAGTSDVRQTIVERAGGNPLYAEEFVRLLADRHGGGDGTEFPDNVHALIAARLDTLPAQRKSLLHDASVIGKVFWADALAEMAGRPVADVQLDLHELSRKELIRPARLSSMEGEAEYAFWHALVRDVAYQQIPRAGRARRHEAAASWIESRASSRVEDVAEVLAHHYLAALELVRSSHDDAAASRLADAARRYLRLSADRALGLDARQAEARLSTAIELTPAEHPERTDLVVRWADAAFQSGRYREAAPAMDEALADLRRIGDPERTADALIRRSEIARMIGDGSPLDLAEEAVSLIRDHPGPLLIEALTELARAQWLVGSSGEASRTAERALELATSLGLAEPARARGYRGLARAELGDRDGIEEADRALELLVSRGAGRDAAYMMSNLALIRWLIDGPLVTLVALEEAATFSRARNIEAATHVIEGNLVDMLADAGRTDDALTMATRHVAAAEQSGDRFDATDAAAWVAYLLAERGDLAGAHEYGDRAVEFGVTAESIDLIVGLARVAHAMLACGDSERARALIETIQARPGVRDGLFHNVWVPVMVRVALGAGDRDLAGRIMDGLEPTYPLHVAGVLAGRAEIAAADDDPERAIGLYASAVTRLRGLGNVRELAHALMGEGRCLRRLGRPGGEASLTEARELFASFGFSARAVEVEALLADGPAELERSTGAARPA